MKKGLVLSAGAAVAAVILSGCAGVGTNSGSIAPVCAGPNFYTEVKANAMIQPTTAKNYTVVKREVTASATLKCYFTCVNIGDVSFDTLRKAALKQAPGATDVIDVKIDYQMSNVCGINTVTATLYGVAVKY